MRIGWCYYRDDVLFKEPKSECRGSYLPVSTVVNVKFTSISRVPGNHVVVVDPPDAIHCSDTRVPDPPSSAWHSTRANCGFPVHLL